MPDDQQERTTAFVSYSWDSEEHQDWVTRLAEAVEREPDIHVTFDQFDLWAGKDLTHFMERAMECERIVVVSTPGYVLKAKERVGGVGYECSLITAELAQSQAQDKFIPVLRDGSEVPAFLQTKLRVDFRDPKNYETALARLLAAIRREPTVIRPAKRNASTSPVDPIYTHTPPAPQPLTPAQAQFSIGWGSSNPLSVGVENPGDFPLYGVRIAVEFASVPHFVVEVGDIGPEEKREVDLLEAGRASNVDAAPIVAHVHAVNEGRIEPRPLDRFLVLSRDNEGSERATAYLLGYDRKSKRLNILTAPVVATYPDVREK